MSSYLLGLRLLQRDWRGGELGLMAAALMVAVTIVVSISLFVERIESAIVAESSQFMAADRLVRSSDGVQDAWRDSASAEGLAHATVLSFASMAYANDELILSDVKAVSDTYPLLGKVRVEGLMQAGAERPSPYLFEQELGHGPAAGSVWIAPRLLNSLQLKIGESLTIGEAELRVDALVKQEPDGGFSTFALGPRIIMNITDIPRSAVVQPGSRVQWDFLVQGKVAALQAWADAVEPTLKPGERIQGVRDNQPRLAATMDRAERFLLLAGSMGVIMAGLAIAIASRRYVERHFNYVAIMRSLGASSRSVIGLYISHLLILTLLAVVLGSLLGVGLHLIAIESIRSLLRVELPPPGIAAFVLGLATALISFIAFALPPLLHLQQVSPMKVLRRELGTPEISNRLLVLLGVIGLMLIIFLYSGSLKITLILAAGVAVIAAVVLLLTWLMLQISPGQGTQAASPFLLALANIRRRAKHSALQVFVFTVVLLLVLVLLLARGVLLKEWRLQLPAQTPNHFVINIRASDLSPMQKVLSSNRIEDAGVYPMLRARLLEHNGNELKSVNTPAESDNKAAKPASRKAGESDSSNNRQNADLRELNLTWVAEFPADNTLVEGRWWAEEPSANNTSVNEVSLEYEFAERYGVALGDDLLFMAGDQRVTLEVSSIRQLDWEKMRPNFFAIASPGALNPVGATYMTSFYLPLGKKEVLNQLLAAAPTLSVLEIDQIINQVKRVIDQVSQAVELVLGLIVLSAIVVLYASVQTSMDERLHETAILKTLGARLGFLRQTMLFEFAMLGLLAGIMAAVGAELVIAAVQVYLLELSYKPHFEVLLLGPLLGVLSIACLGWLIGRQSLNAAPAQVLRELS